MLRYPERGSPAMNPNPEQGQNLRFVVDEAAEQRLDKFLVAQLPELSRSRIQALIKEALVTVGGKPAVKTGQVVEAGDEVLVHIPSVKPATLEPEDIPLDIIFENSDLVLINKPAGLVVHPAAGHATGTLVHAVLAHAPDLDGIGGELRPGVVHRLDKETSGLILFAKNDFSYRWLQEQFKKRTIKKTYLALVDGHPPTPSGRIEAPVGRDPSHRKKMAIVSQTRGREAVTEYHTRESFANHTLIEANLLTGRTHQIRLHLAFLGCPIVGDSIYGHRHSTLPITRHFLHAWKLKFVLPRETEPREFEAPLPEELACLLDGLR